MYEAPPLLGFLTLTINFTKLSQAHDPLYEAFLLKRLHPASWYTKIFEDSKKPVTYLRFGCRNEMDSELTN